ncbi:glycosyltransferase family A protein [Rhodobacter sp. 24-YEA-8]|uniref:glycosyltransferase family 2 protein n=1 Tax=Rhodobacter sp. 24-YEA-8 TaxID=1884310 RepID=UPI000899EEC4|nr:glycosyltransferase family A protein [Rhodobacter sp. 24-YEA-8]SEB43754.1 Glycosyl transferase family 2 [Rhodobacter sp. 24-YEA-8]
MPKVTIGVPVYNGVSLIQRCLENLAAQDFDDFEVIISDNASTDGTSEICSGFATKDRRFRHVRHAETSSANDNFRWVRDAADSEYFAFRAYDDISSPDYFRKLAGILQAGSHLHLAAGNIRQDFGPVIGMREAPWISDPAIEAAAPEQRIPYRMFACQAGWFYGLWRKKALTQALDRVLSQYDDLWAGDHLILLHAMLADGVAGTSDPDVEFIQGILPGPSHYGSSRRPRWSVMKDRNTRFLACARDLLAETDMTPATRRAVDQVLVRYTYKRCYPWRRVAKARLRMLLGIER